MSDSLPEPRPTLVDRLEADMRYTLRTTDGALLYVRSHGVRHRSADVLARLA
jgi:hypothetical protein